MTHELIATAANAAATATSEALSFIDVSRPVVSVLAERNPNPQAALPGESDRYFWQLAQ
jgi:hypothetical protein